MTTTINASTSAGLVQTADTSGSLALQTAGTTAITVSTSQQVGIGATPSAQLQVFTQDSASGKAIRAAYDATYYCDYTENALNCYNNNYSINVKSGSNLIFKTADTERMRIGSGGIVSVGTTLTDNPLGGFVLYVANQNSQLMVGHETGTSSGNAYAKFCLNGSNIGSITQVGTTAVAYNTSSDYRLKENIAPLTGALAKVAQLKPVTYTWKSAPDENGEGFIAHELAEVCPQAVHGTKDEVDADGNPVYQGIDTSFLVATLTSAIQEQQATITALTARIEALENK